MKKIRQTSKEQELADLALRANETEGDHAWYYKELEEIEERYAKGRGKVMISWEQIWMFAVIDHPRHKDVVKFKDVVSGRVYPWCRSVQVWVLSGDGRYYNQPNVLRDGNRWSVTCQFGYETPRYPGSWFDVVVTPAITEIKVESTKKLPFWVPKTTIRVYRTMAG